VSSFFAASNVATTALTWIWTQITLRDFGTYLHPCRVAEIGPLWGSDRQKPVPMLTRLGFFIEAEPFSNRLIHRQGQHFTALTD
jgi:hypothetical protein